MRDHFPPDVGAALFEQSVDGVLITSPDGSTHRANPAACRILGWTEAQLQQMGRAGLADPTDDRWALAVTTRARDGHFRGLLRMRHGDGGVVEVDVSTSVYVGGDGDSRAFAVFRDVSEYMSLVRQAADSIDVVEAMTDAFYTVDADLRVRFMNSHAQRLLSLDADQARGRGLFELLPHAAGTTVEAGLRRAIASGTTTVLEVDDDVLGLVSEARVFPTRDGGAAVFFRDIAHRRAAEVERERLLEAERSARRAAEFAQVQLRHRATHDELTGLLNRTGLVERVAGVWDGEHVSSMCLIFVDLDRFKLVNDSLGHGIGDEVLAAFAGRLASLAGPGDLLARFGGDEFVIVVFDATAEHVERMGAQVIEASREPVTVPGAGGSTNTLFVTCSVGISQCDRDGDLPRLLREADAALYRAKDAGRERAVWFDQDLHAQVLEKIRVEHELRVGIADGQLELHYQPAFDLASGHAVHVEALVRWRHPERGLIAPLVFIPVAEESGLIEPLGDWVIGEAARQAAAWDHVPGLRVWVNVSPRQLVAPDFADRLAAALDAAGCRVDRFGIEVTESTLDDDEGLGAQVRRVRGLGVAVAIDDFGTGYSSLARLTRAPVDVIKIDRSFVSGVAHEAGYAVLDGIVSLAHSLGASVIAEGVETSGQLSKVAQTGCDIASGYLLARPVPSADVTWTAAAEGGLGR